MNKQNETAPAQDGREAFDSWFTDAPDDPSSSVLVMSVEDHQRVVASLTRPAQTEQQPAEVEGVSNARLMNTLAELARRAPLRTLHTICETQHQVSTVKLERYLELVGDTLAGYAFTLRIDFDKLSAALSAVTAERDKLREAFMRMRNVAAGYSNCCEFDSANTRRLEREFEAADELFRSSATLAEREV